eukprot:1191783-Prorocentrum_minimum.AAC.3
MLPFAVRHRRVLRLVHPHAPCQRHPAGHALHQLERPPWRQARRDRHCDHDGRGSEGPDELLGHHAHALLVPQREPAGVRPAQRARAGQGAGRNTSRSPSIGILMLLHVTGPPANLPCFSLQEDSAACAHRLRCVSDRLMSPRWAAGVPGEPRDHKMWQLTLRAWQLTLQVCRFTLRAWQKKIALPSQAGFQCHHDGQLGSLGNPAKNRP